MLGVSHQPLFPYSWSNNYFSTISVDQQGFDIASAFNLSFQPSLNNGFRNLLCMQSDTFSNGFPQCFAYGRPQCSDNPTERHS